jgi:hypothetical protein
MKKAIALVVAFIGLGTFGFGQIHLEISGFGGFNPNLSFPQTMSIDAGFQARINPYLAEWKNLFQNPILEPVGGALFGGRLALQVTPMWGFEGGVEYSLAQFQLNADKVAALQSKMAAYGFDSYFTYNTKGGHILRFYGNVVLSIPVAGSVQPYLTAGIGSTSFAVPVSIAATVYSEHLDLHYENVSALTFNGGGGIKLYLNDTIGLRIDARVFYGSPEFKQFFSHVIGSTTDVAPGDWVTQSGSHLDASISAGLFIRLM